MRCAFVHRAHLFLSVVLGSLGLLARAPLGLLRRRARRVLSMLVLAGTCPAIGASSASAATLTVRGFGTPRAISNSHSIYYNVTGSGGAEIMDPANFAGYGVTGVTRLSAITTTVTAADLDGVDIFFTGLIGSPNFSSAEVTVLSSFINAGGVVIAHGDNTGFNTQLNPLLNAFGVSMLTPNYGGDFANPASLTMDAPSHPILDGPFGTITNLKAWDSARFSSTEAGSILASYPDLAGAIVAVGPSGARQGALIAFPDSEGYLSNFYANYGANYVGHQGEAAFNNAVAYAITVIPEPGSLAVFALGALPLLARRRH